VNFITINKIYVILGKIQTVVRWAIEDTWVKKKCKGQWLY